MRVAAGDSVVNTVVVVSFYDEYGVWISTSRDVVPTIWVRAENKAQAEIKRG